MQLTFFLRGKKKTSIALSPSDAFSQRLKQFYPSILPFRLMRMPETAP